MKARLREWLLVQGLLRWSNAQDILYHYDYGECGRSGSDVLPAGKALKYALLMCVSSVLTKVASKEAPC